MNGDVQAFGGNVRIEGEVTGDVNAFAGNVRVAGTVGGTITRAEDIQAGPWQGPIVPGWVLGIYGFFVNLLPGTVLLLAFPAFSAAVAERVATDPVRTGAVGLLAIVAIPILLLVLLVTIIGILLALVGALLFGLLVWVALVYGRFAVGAWLLSLVDVESRWLGLLVGLFVTGLAGVVPWIGGLIDFVVILLCLGAVSARGHAGYRRRRA